MTGSPASWKNSLRLFFAERAERVDSVPSIEELCLIAGREPRLWSDRRLYEDLIASIVLLCRIDAHSTVLEVGCAAGFLARGIAPLAKRYVGVDVASSVLRVARRLGLPNADFQLADGARLPMADGTFDAAYCYDVFTNLPDFQSGGMLIDEMLRVVRPGGSVLIGSVPDAARQQAYEERVREVMRALDRQHGPPPTLPQGKPRPWYRNLFRRFMRQDAPAITCYYFHRSAFTAHAAHRGVPIEIGDIHQGNPYAAYRFNAIYTKPER